jgi:NAD(P)-dependent dehydrogenase (short-subunit alcohol dehydrogenase family)
VNLAGKRVVIIGGGSGIGLEVARRAAASGASVHLGGRTPEKLSTAAKEVGGTWQVVDSTDQDSLR